jgi:hypothetical protein
MSSNRRLGTDGPQVYHQRTSVSERYARAGDTTRDDADDPRQRTDLTREGGAQERSRRDLPPVMRREGQVAWRLHPSRAYRDERTAPPMPFRQDCRRYRYVDDYGLWWHRLIL